MVGKKVGPLSKFFVDLMGLHLQVEQLDALV